MNTDNSSSLAQKIKELRELKRKSNAEVIVRHKTLLPNEDESVRYVAMAMHELPKLLDALEIQEKTFNDLIMGCEGSDMNATEDFVVLKVKKAQAKVNDLFVSETNSNLENKQ